MLEIENIKKECSSEVQQIRELMVSRITHISWLRFLEVAF